ncbi:MAG: urea transporter, partial [Nonomuraea sp.]|nr:urea transporter [Nonomuraea sp.]
MSSTSQVPGPAPGAGGVRALDRASAIAKGVAQVMFQANAWTGLVFLAGLFVGGWQFGVFGLLGTVVATLTAALLGVSWTD